MERMPRNTMVNAGVAVFVWMLTVGVLPVGAQHLGGILPLEGEEGYVDVAAEESYGEAMLVPQATVEEYSTEKITDGVPDFIRESSYYTLGTNDVIEVEVLRHPEVSGQYMINNEGKIQYEFVGDVTVEGLKKDEVRDLLTNLLSEYIISPDVTVKIIGYNSKIVYVVGEVASPGKIFMRGDTITVREALVQSGLPLLSAKTTKGKLITPSDSGDADMKNVNIHKLLYEGDLRENLVMKPGDTLYVPPTFLAKTMRVIQPIAQPIGVTAGTGRTLTTGF